MPEVTKENPIPTPQNNTTEPAALTEQAHAPETPDKPSKPSKKLFAVILAVVLLTFVVGSVGAYFLFSKFPKTQPSPLGSPEPTAEAADPTADWKTFTNQEAGINYKYPSNWQAFGDSVFSNGTIKNTPQENFIEPEDRNDFAVISFNSQKNTKNTSLEDITKSSYSPANFKETTIGNKSAIRVTQDNENVSQYGKIVSVWFQGDSDTFYFIQLESYNLEKYEPIFDQILSTFKFTDSKYKDDKVGFEFDNPLSGTTIDTDRWTFSELVADYEYHLTSGGGDYLSGTFDMFVYNSDKEAKDWWDTEGKTKWDKFTTSQGVSSGISYIPSSTTFAGQKAYKVIINSTSTTPYIARKNNIIIFQHNGYLGMISYHGVGDSLTTTESEKLLSTFKFTE